MPVFAQDGQPGPVTDDEVNTIAKDLYCPVCENIPLDVCPTQACEEWRQDIREKLLEGWSETQIKEYFVVRYGDRVLATPPARGLNWVVYLIPPLVIILGAVFLFRTMSHWRQRSALQVQQVDEAQSHTTGASSAKDDEYMRKLEEELKKR